MPSLANQLHLGTHLAEKYCAEGHPVMAVVLKVGLVWRAISVSIQPPFLLPRALVFPARADLAQHTI